MSARTVRTLQSIEIATHCVPVLDECVRAYTDLLGFRLVDSGPISDALCAVWATPAMAGMPHALLQPASGAECYLRFIETGNASGYWPPVTQGWIATEMLATEPDELKLQLESTAFKRIGGPADLYPGPKSARAMQMSGPAGELMYFTRILPGGSRFGLKGAQSFVDRPFIMVVGCNSMQKLVEFYGGVLHQRIVESNPFTIDQMSRVLGAPLGTQYPVSIAVLPGRKFLLELEELPAQLERRTVPAGQLPEGLAMVTFAAPPLSTLDLPFRAPPKAIDAPPYSGRTAGVVVGPAGEWLELVGA